MQLDYLDSDSFNVLAVLASDFASFSLVALQFFNLMFQNGYLSLNRYKCTTARLTKDALKGDVPSWLQVFS